MNAQTLRALRASIAHWKRMAKNGIKGKDEPYAEECALCALFLAEGCFRCPVFKSTGEEECGHTPYFEARDNYEFGKYTGKDSNFKISARKEVQFLESLLPVKSKSRKL